MHHDIVRLLDEFVPPNPQMNTFHNSLGCSPLMIPPPTVMGSTKAVKPKKRPKMNTIAGLPTMKDVSDATLLISGDGTIRRKASVKKRKEPLMPMEGSVALSPVNSLESPQAHTYMDGTSSPLDTNLYTGHMLGMSHPNLPNLENGCGLPGKDPPNYEDCVNHNSQLGYGMVGNVDGRGNQMYMNSCGMVVPVQGTQSLKSRHPRQNSMPSNLTTQHVPTSHSYTISSQRPSLPTSPTHMAALRAAHHQKTVQLQNQQSANPNSPYDYTSNMTNLQHLLNSSAAQNSMAQTITTNQPVCYSHKYHYPTPPSQHSHGGAEATPQHYFHGPETYLTPSPESPGQWSSSSPHSALSDWSEGISSPLGPSNMHQVVVDPNQQKQLQQHAQNLQSQQSHPPPEAVFI